MLTDQEQANLTKKIMDSFTKDHPELNTRFGDTLSQMIINMEKNYVGIAVMYTLKYLAEADRLQSAKAQTQPT